MLKILMIFGVGLCEQCLYTAYLISVNKRQAILSSILMLVYMSLYLFIVAYALKDTNAIGLLITYACACGVGNLITMKWENRTKTSVQKKIYVIAGNYREFVDYAKGNNKYIYVNEIQRLQGIHKQDVVLVGRYYSRNDWDILKSELIMSEAKIKYEKNKKL